MRDLLGGFGVQEHQYRVSFAWGSRALDSAFREVPQDAFVSFRGLNKLTLFKMSWRECQRNDDSLFKVVLPTIRRVMPTLIAHDIVGVSPMQGPVENIHKMRKDLDDAQSVLASWRATSSSGSNFKDSPEK